MASRCLFCEKWEKNNKTIQIYAPQQRQHKDWQCHYNPLSIQHMCVQILGRALPAGTLLGSSCWALPNPASNGLHPAGPQYVLQECSEILQGRGPCWANTQSYCLGFFLRLISPGYLGQILVEPRECITNLTTAACDQPYLFCIIIIE